MSIHRMFALFVALAVAACGGGRGVTSTSEPPGSQDASGSETPAGTNKGAGTMRLSGTVRSQESVRSVPTPAYLAEVKATIDRNHDGAISADETWTALTDGDGAYALDVPVDPGETLVVRFSDVNGAPVLRTVKAAPGASIILNAMLGELEEPECVLNDCAWGRADLALIELPPGTLVRARVVDPIAENDMLPDHMQDSAGNVLVPAAFAVFQVEDDASIRRGKLADSVEMRLRIPKETWDIVRDVESGNDSIDVPLYWFDEVKGAWARDPVPARLEDGHRNVIAPSLLPSIRDGSFAGAIYAVGGVDHLSNWSVAWPIGAPGHVSGRVLDEAGKPAEGAAVTVKGVSYTGTSTTVVLGPDGRFCLDARRSEAPGEDLDGNGRVGEKATVSIGAVARGNFYDLGEFETPLAAGSCGSAGSIDLGDLGLSATTQRNTDWCTINGTVRYPDGMPGGEEVNLRDDNVRPDVLESMCTTGLDWTCKTAHVDPTGAFTVKAPVRADLKLESGMTREIEPGVFEADVALRNFASCPKEAVALTLVPRSTFVHFVVSVVGNSISWTPARYGVSLVTVWSASGMKWQSYAWQGQMKRVPVTYGELESDTIQVYPRQGAAAPLAPGDWVTVEAVGLTTVDGVPYSGSGTTEVR